MSSIKKKKLGCHDWIRHLRVGTQAGEVGEGVWLLGTELAVPSTLAIHLRTTAFS